jgi:outer membrane protein insertion porin family
MNVEDPADPLLPPPKGHHRSARERQRRGPMWGCLRTLVLVFGSAFLLLFLIIGGGWWYLGTASFADLVKLRIEKTLESRMGRDVTIGSVTIVRSRPAKVIINDLRIANVPGGVARYFATVRQVEILGGVESFWGRKIKVGRVDIRDPQLWFEIAPDGTHNFPPWKTGPTRRYEIVHLDIGQLFATGGGFSFLDRKHDIEAVATKIGSKVTVTRAEDLYEGVLDSPNVRVRIQEYVPFDVDLHGGFRYTPGVLALRSIALKGRGIEAFVAGQLNPLTEGVYDLRIDSRLALERVREIFKVEKTLAGTITLDTHLKGKQGEYRLTGGWVSPHITADTYDLTNAKGRLDLNPNNLALKVEKASYGGGTIAADYVLATLAEPYPMKIDLRYYGISIEKLFSDWTIENTGLRAAATGNLTYRWNKDKVLEGAGEGTARLAKNSVAFSDARYPIPVAGMADFALDRGTVLFRKTELDTEASHVSLTGSMKIEGVILDIRTAIRSTDFSELDRLAFNFAHSAGKKDFTLLGLGGAGTITGEVKGPIDKPQLVAHATGSAVRYNNVVLGDADLDLRYDGNRSVLTFDRANFADAGGRLSLTGTLTFPETGRGPLFDIAVEANGYPAQRAIDAMGLDMKIGAGAATGKMIIAGTPDDGRATFVGLVIRRADATLKLDGTVHWMPGKGNVEFDLAIAANNFPVADIAAFLDFANIPVTGDLTGTLKIAGRKESLEGRGSVAVRNGVVMGEPVELASADIAFTQGRMRATNVLVRSAAGEIRGEAELDLAKEKFSYTIASSSIDLSKLKLLASLQNLLGGHVVLKSTGAGTFEQPELVVEATLEGATLRGLALPEGSAPPSLYLAIRNGRLIVRGSIADIVSIEGEGSVGKDLAVDGLVRVTVSDIARAIAISPATSTLPASGNLVLELKLGGKLTPLEALVIEATAPVFNLKIADHQFTTPETPRLTLRNGRLTFDSFALRSEDSSFTVTGYADITGNKRVDVDVRGRIEAALLQLFARDMRADGRADVAVHVAGVVTNPTVTGTIELVDAQVKFAGFPQLIDEINGTLRFRGDRLEIESVRATVGGGSVVAGGSILLQGMKPQRARITIQGTGVALRYYEGITVEGNFNLLFSGDLERATITGDVDVTRALYYREFDVQQTLLNVILSRSRVTPVTTATWQDRIGLNIHLAAPGTLAVTNNIANVTGSATLDVTGTVAAPVILGEVTLDEGGSVRIQNVDYRLVRGTISFQNPFRIDPFFDVTIEGTVAGNMSEIESGPLDVTVNLTGTLDRITPTITSDPPASDITLFSILGFGALGSRPGTQQAGYAGLMGQSLLYQSLVGALASRVLPFVDSFTYDPGLLDTGSGPGRKVAFEKRLSNSLRFLIVYNLDNNQSRQVLEWVVNRSYTLQLTRDETDEYRLDARFRRRYDAQWKFGHDEEEDFATAATMTRSGGAAGSSAPVTGDGGLKPATPPPTTTVNIRAADAQTVERIDFRADAPFDTTTVDDLVTLKPGQPVTIRELQSSIKNLYASGNFRDVRVDAAPGTNGVVLTFSLLLNYRVGEIFVAGLRGGDRSVAERELTVRTGEVLSLDAVDDSARAVQEELNRNGFLEATVDPETEFNRARSIAAVTFHVTPGPEAKISNVILEGDTRPFDAKTLVQQMKRHTGSVFHLRDARSDAERIKNYLLRRDYRRADVDFVDYKYDTASHGVTLRYRATVGPKVRVEVAGVPRSAVRRLLPFRRRNAEYSEDVVDRAADDIVRAYQQRGYYNAAVDTESSLENGTWVTTFHVAPGARYRLESVTFSGNVKVPDKQLAEVVATSPKSGFFKRIISSIFRRPTGITSQQLSDDRDAIESHYRLEGFSEAVAATPVVATNDAAGTMTVDFPVTEGPQTIVTEVAIEGNEKFGKAKLPQIQIARGKPLNPQQYHEDVVALQSFYADRGYTEVQVSPRIELSDDKTEAKVTYVMAEGPRVTVDQVIVRGNTYTKDSVILRRSNLDPGDPFSYTSVLEAQRELYRLGIFQRVEVQPEQVGTSVSDRDVVVSVEEGKNLTLSGAVGLRFTRSQPKDKGRLHERLALAAAHRNLFGTGRYLGLETVFSRDEQEAFLTYREPFIGHFDVPLQMQIYQTDDNTRTGTHIRQRGTKIEATKVARSRTRWSLSYEYKISECVVEDAADPNDLCAVISRGEPVEGLDRSLQNIQISSIAPTFFWDTRDDIIDPHHGFFTSAAIEYAFPFIAAEANFMKEYVQGAYYIPLSARTVVALSGRVGLIQPLGDTTDADVPLSERFIAGGENTHRAFPLDLLGNLCTDPGEPKDCQPTLFKVPGTSTILPLGGSGLLLFNAEYRFPIFQTLGGAVFVDAGNVYRSTRMLNFDDLRYGVGLGLRYISPVGPLRIDVGYPIDRRSYDRAFSYFITLGYAF